MKKSLQVGQFEVSFEAVGGNSVPIPPKIINTEPETGYVSEKLSEEEKQELKTGAKLFADLLEMGRHVSKDYVKAAEHVKRFRSGTGEGSNLSQDEVGEMERFTAGGNEEDENGEKIPPVPIVSLLEAFKGLIKQDFKGKTSQAYLSWDKKDKRNWFGANSDNRKWHYAVGMFWIAYGAYLSRSGQEVTMKYSMYVCDRYNWSQTNDAAIPYVKDVGNAVGNFAAVQMNRGRFFGLLEAPLGQKLNINHLSGLANIKTPAGEPYVSKGKNGEDRYSDALMGSLQEFEGAKTFDIWGQGRERIETYIEDNR